MSCARPLVKKCQEGFNVTVLAYGQTVCELSFNNQYLVPHVQDKTHTTIRSIELL